MSIETEIKAIIDSPGTSNWLRSALKTAMQRDCVEAVNDAETLLSILDRNATEKLEAARAILDCHHRVSSLSSERIHRP